MAKGPAQRGDGGRSAPGKDDNRASGMGDGGGGYSPGVSGKASARPGGLADITQAVAQRSGVNKAASDGMIAAMAAMAPRQPAVAGSMATPANAYVGSPSAPAAVGPQTLQDLLASPGFRLDPEGTLDALPQGQLRSDAERYLSTSPDLGYAIAPDIQGTAAGMYGAPSQTTTIAGTRNVMGSGMNPANAYVTPSTPPTASMGGFPHAQGISGVNDPYAYSNMPGRVPGADSAGPSLQTPVGLQQGSGFAPSSLPAVGAPAAQQPLSQALSYGPPTRAVIPGGDARAFLGSELVSQSGTPTQAPAAPAQTPTPQPTQISAQDIAQNTAATSGGTPVEYSAGVVPSSATMPGIGLMSGIQQGIGAIRDVFSGDRQLFGENGMLPADSRTSEERMADFLSSSSDDAKDFYDLLYGSLGMTPPETDDGGDTPEPTPPTTPYVPNIPAPYYTPSTLSPYVPSAAPTNPVYGYSSYNALQQAMGMAEGGAVRPSMNNAFTPGTYYARYNPYARGLGALRRG